MEPVTKKCTACKEEKELRLFASVKSNPTGKGALCSRCDGKKTQTYRRTKKGLVFKIMKKQREKSIMRNHPIPEYSLEELREWAFSQEAFHKIYDEWVLSGYNKWKIPSCDRLDNSKGYSLNNIQIVTWRENYDNFVSDRKNGISNIATVKVSQFSLAGEFIETFQSIKEANIKTGTKASNISLCRIGKRKTANGFIWK